MTDKLREALEAAAVWHEAQDKALSKQPPDLAKGWRRLEHQEQAEAIRAALAAAQQPMGCGLPCGFDCNGACFDWAAAPQPALADREALVEVIRRVSATHGSCIDGAPEAIADDLLARGLRLPGEETMAWAVVGEDGKIDPRKLWINSRDAEEYCERGERAVRVAIRVVEGGDDA